MSMNRKAFSALVRFKYTILVLSNRLIISSCVSLFTEKCRVVNFATGRFEDVATLIHMVIEIHQTDLQHILVVSRQTDWFWCHQKMHRI